MGLGEVEIRPGKSGQFDITIDGQLKFSRHKVGRFPTDPELDGLAGK